MGENHARLPALVATAGLCVVVAGAYYELTFGVTVGLTLVTTLSVAAAATLAPEPPEPPRTSQ